MQQKPDSPEHHRQRSEFIRKLVQRSLGQHSVDDRYRHLIPRTIVQFWHDLSRLPFDVEECVASWTCWETSGFTPCLFDKHAAKAFISHSLGARHEKALSNAAITRQYRLTTSAFATCLSKAASMSMQTMFVLAPTSSRCSRTVGSNSSPSATMSLLGRW